MGRACSTNVGDEKCLRSFDSKDQKKEIWKGEGSIELAFDRDRWRVLVNTIMEILFP
jgi:hypothetical protein